MEGMSSVDHLTSESELELVEVASEGRSRG